MKFPGNLQDILQTAQQLQQNIKSAQEAAEHKEVEASAGGGMVTVTVTGAGLLKAVKIDKEVVNPNDIEMLQDLVLAAVNEGMRRAKELAKDELSQATGGFPIPPGIFGSGFNFGG